MSDDITEPLRMMILQRMRILKLNQSQVADSAGISNPHFNQWLMGKRQMNLVSINKVCEVLDGKLVLTIESKK